jgi:hypothetical protein
MKTVLLTMTLAAAAAFGQSYKAEAAGAPPDAAASLKGMLEAQGTKIVDGSGKVYCEIWLRTGQPSDAKSSEQNITLPELPHGALIGVISFPADASDRRGQKIKAGTYTLRYSMFPITGDHQGVAPQRDFLVLGPLASDTDGSATPNFQTLMTMGQKASGTTHPLILSMWKADQPQVGFAKEGEHDWVLQKKLGNLTLAIILIGRAEG